MNTWTVVGKPLFKGSTDRVACIVVQAESSKAAVVIFKSHFPQYRVAVVVPGDRRGEDFSASDS